MIFFLALISYTVSMMHINKMEVLHTQIELD
jgi:hypothetical protein